MKVIKRYKLKEMPVKEYSDGKWILPTGYFVMFDDNSYAVEFENSNFEYSEDCITIDEDDFYEKKEEKKSENITPPLNEVVQVEEKPEKIEKDDKQGAKKCVKAVISLGLALIGNSIYQKNKRNSIWKVISFMLFYILFFGIVDTMDYFIEDIPWKKRGDDKKQL